MKNIVIYSHGFGTRKDDRGLFLSIIDGLNSIEAIMFDYNEVNEVENTITVKPLSQQANILKEVIIKYKQSNPDIAIDLICHSQGCVVAALLKPLGIRKTIFIAPLAEFNVDRLIETFKNREGSEINIEGISRLARQDGSITFVPSEFWKELESINLVDLYNDFSKETDLNIIVPNQDEILENSDFSKLSKKVKIIKLDGDHNFLGNSRNFLINEIKNILI